MSSMRYGSFSPAAGSEPSAISAPSRITQQRARQRSVSGDGRDRGGPLRPGLAEQDAPRASLSATGMSIHRRLRGRRTSAARTHARHAGASGEHCESPRRDRSARHLQTPSVARASPCGRRCNLLASPARRLPAAPRLPGERAASPAERDQRADTAEQLPERIWLRDHAEAEVGVDGLPVGVGARAGGDQLGRRALEAAAADAARRVADGVGPLPDVPALVEGAAGARRRRVAADVRCVADDVPSSRCSASRRARCTRGLALPAGDSR